MIRLIDRLWEIIELRTDAQADMNRRMIAVAREIT